MEIDANDLFDAYQDNLIVRLATGETGEVTNCDLNSENETAFEITTENGYFWVDESGNPCDCECSHSHPSRVVEVLED
ncbi:TPA: hypothetical protein QB430_001353 [Pasteurella multocida]|uniref:hypothetical protein n=1 Tax=Pasteurella multocida TaxID=747 RepID=UPI002020F8F9|nr:hypothetical protein [Pasteurella multocida]MCL7790125.1 hypothetical protein [Pasteurella multocida]HDR1228808.1 hypothetical protein [Pasteurella multocida]HDR1302906.1 hypothetical protein [Pasteurella multocida]HDR1349397.1 hypothetical protein [Pasteurella multocida]HDR1901749.1 hypothetical protein [Pasteurella multocida]